MTQSVYEWGHGGNGVSLLFPLTLLTFMCCPWNDTSQFHTVAMDTQSL